MSTTMTLTMSEAPDGAHASCPNCGMGLPGPNHSEIAADAQKQIEDLQAQVRLLTQKATAAGSSLTFSSARRNYEWFGGE
jgi:hypothetical protein